MFFTETPASFNVIGPAIEAAFSALSLLMFGASSETRFWLCKSLTLYKDLVKVSKKVDVHDYYADKLSVKKEFGIELIQNLNNNYDIIVLAVAHNKYLKLDYSKLLKKNHILANQSKKLTVLLLIFPRMNE